MLQSAALNSGFHRIKDPGCGGRSYQRYPKKEVPRDSLLGLSVLGLFLGNFLTVR